jgi:hypothetical protein
MIRCHFDPRRPLFGGFTMLSMSQNSDESVLEDFLMQNGRCYGVNA